MKGTITMITLLIAVLFFAMSTSTLAALNETGDTTLTILSTPPTVASVEVNEEGDSGDNEIDLTPATVTSINCWGTITDPDGTADISNVKAYLYAYTTTYNAANHDDRHYTNSTCGYNTGTGAYNCTFPDVQFYAVNGTWTCRVNATDYASNTNISSDTTTVNQLLAIDIPDATEVDFGSIQVGQSSAEQSVTLENEGNIAIDIETDVYRDDNDTTDTNAMNCTTGLIPAININASLTSGSDYSPMEDATILSLDANLAEATGNDQVPTTDIVYFTLEVPAGGVAGTCDGTIFFGATLS